MAREGSGRRVIGLLFNSLGDRCLGGAERRELCGGHRDGSGASIMWGTVGANELEASIAWLEHDGGVEVMRYPISHNGLGFLHPAFSIEWSESSMAQALRRLCLPHGAFPLLAALQGCDYEQAPAMNGLVIAIVTRARKIT